MDTGTLILFVENEFSKRYFDQKVDLLYRRMSKIGGLML